MPDLTVRNIPESLMSRIRILAETERRSVNNEILVLLETGIDEEIESGGTGRTASVEVQLALWEQLCGKWEDERPASEIVRDIMEHRTLGREVAL